MNDNFGDGALAALDDGRPLCLFLLVLLLVALALEVISVLAVEFGLLIYGRWLMRGILL
jgi:hypothetical protein